MLSITPVPLPEHHTDPLWRDLQLLVREYNHLLIGNDGWDIADDMALARARANREYDIVRLLAHEGDVPVGYAVLRINTVDSPEAANVHVYVSPAHRGRGVGTKLADELRQLVVERKLKRLTAWPLVAPPNGVKTLSPSSGTGSVPADAPEIRFALKHGFALSHVERVSFYPLDDPPSDPARHLAEARAKAGPDYEVITWEGRTPEGMEADLAALKQRMSTDVPNGDLVVEESAWDAQRIRDRDDEWVSIMRVWRTAVRHVPSGRIVAVSELMHDLVNPRAIADQWDTVVDPDHRGHRLGMIVKAANIVLAREKAPEAPGIITWNAEENRQMLAINEALGFEEILVEAAFQRIL